MRSCVAVPIRPDGDAPYVAQPKQLRDARCGRDESARPPRTAAALAGEGMETSGAGRVAQRCTGEALVPRLLVVLPNRVVRSGVVA